MFARPERSLFFAVATWFRAADDRPRGLPASAASPEHDILAKMRSSEPSSPPPAADAWIEFERQLHGRFELDPVALVLVNEARRLIGCDRVLLLVVRRGRASVTAVSGQETFDRRSNIVRAVETFVAAIAPLGEPFAYDGPTASGGAAGALPQVDAALSQLLDVTHGRRLAVVPFRAPVDDADRDERHEHEAPPIEAWLVAEQFTQATGGVPLFAAAQEVVRRAGPALHNAVEFDRLPLRRVGQTLRRLTRGRAPSRVAVVVGLLLAAVAALVFIPAELKIEVRGVMQPHERRHVFAPADGVVLDLDIRHGETVAQDKRLLTMRRPELEFELTRLDGEIQTHEKRLNSIQATRLRRTGPSAPDSNELLRLTAEEQEVQQELTGLRRQREELQRQAATLTVVSPIAGQVLTWDLERQLRVRPVQKGTLLLTVGNVAGAWELELDVPDDYVGYVRRAQAAGGKEPPTVEFVAASAPESTYTARLADVAVRSRREADGRSFVTATAPLAAGVPRELLRPDAAVLAKIHCGRRSLGYVWFLDMIHLVRTQLLF
jgi:hypothetical protein